MRHFAQSQNTFVNYGGSYQLKIDCLDDLRALSTLDETHWMATSAPVHQLRVDAAFLAHMDSDGNDRIISTDLRQTAAWLFEVLSDTAGVSSRAERLSLETINAEDASGKDLLRTAERVLENLGKKGETSIGLDNVRDQSSIMAKGDGNGDGVIPPGSVDDDDVDQLITDVMDTIGGIQDVSGCDGVDAAHLDAFIDAAQSFLDWKKKVFTDGAGDFDRLHPIGEKTAEAYDLYMELAPKIDEWFELSRLAALNATLDREVPVPAFSPDLYTDGEARRSYMKDAPISKPLDGVRLDFGVALNPYYADVLRLFQEKVYIPMVRDAEDHGFMDADVWRNIKLMFMPYGDWRESKSGEQVERLGAERLEAYVSGELPARLRTLFAADVEAGEELKALKDVEKLILCQHCFLDLCNNFISFADMYNPKRNAMFEAGRVVIDGRAFNFNMRVKDVAKHAKIAERSGIYLMYSEVTGLPGDPSFYLVTPVTSRHLGTIAVEKRGVLFDLEGKQWDVRVVKVVENPISLTEAVKAPFVRLSKMISSAAQKFTASTEKQLEGSLSSTSKNLQKGVGSSMKPGAKPVAKAPAKKTAAPVASGGGAKDLLLSGSMAIGILGSSMTLVLKMLSEIEPMAALSGLCVGLVVILVPVVIIAAFRLYSRNLSGILEASGWAINSRMRLTARLARLLSPEPVHPKSFAQAQKDLLSGFSDSMSGSESDEW